MRMIHTTNLRIHFQKSLSSVQGKEPFGIFSQGVPFLKDTTFVGIIFIYFRFYFML